MKLAAILALAIVAVLDPEAPTRAQKLEDFVVGVLRRDGIVTPFAAFDGRRWRARWPADMRNRDLPISLDEVPEDWWGVEPAPRVLSIWRDGARAGTVTLTGIAITRPMCEPRMTLKSDYRAATTAPPPFELPYPKDGLVVTGDVPVEPIEILAAGSAAANRVLTKITDRFNREETVAAGSFALWVHPVPPEGRRRLPITIEALYAAPTRDAGWTAYYVEVVREYPPGPRDKDGCGLATFGHGWVIVGPKEEVRVHISARVTYCDRKGVSYMLPLGLIRANDHNYWVFQSSGFEEEWYEIVEPTRHTIQSQLAYPVGACPR